MLLYGAGGHARVLISLMQAIDKPVEAIFDDNQTQQLLDGVPIVGGYDLLFKPTEEILLAIGDNQTRCRLAAAVHHPPGRAVHPTAILAPGVTLGGGTVVLHGAIVQANGRLGKHVIVNTGALVDHDCVLDNFAQVAPGSILCGNVRLGEGALIGAGAVVLPGIRVGAWAVVGAGAVVTHDVPDGAVTWGNPARFVRYREG